MLLMELHSAIDMENRSCVFSGRAVATDCQGQNIDKVALQFKKAAEGLRGVTAWVEREGSFSVNDDIVLHIPDQRQWKYLADIT